MANDYFSWTVALPEGALPSVPGLSEELPDAVSEAMGQPRALRISSRGDWLHYGLKNAVAQFSAPTLAFLAVDPHSLPTATAIASLPGNNNAWLVTVLPCAELSRAVEEIEAWQSMAESDPGRFATALADDWGDRVREEARRAVDMLEFPDTGLEGDDPVSFFSFLKALRSLLISARSRGFGIVHVRFVLI